MDTKLFIACLLFSFITGCFTCILVTKDRGCTVTFSKGQEVHVMTGSL